MVTSECHDLSRVGTRWHVPRDLDMAFVSVTLWCGVVSKGMYLHSKFSSTW